MPVTDLENIEIAQGKHYHAWVLLPHVTTLYNGHKVSHLAYSPSMQPHTDRTTARRHAKQMGDGGGYMALKCGGGEECPLLFYLEQAFVNSGAKEVLTPHHEAAEGESQ